MDVISLTSYAHRPAGREAHRAFLGSDGPGQPIRLIEDMSLAGLHSQPLEVHVFPLLIRDADGAPATVVARLKRQQDKGARS
jgi:kynurenine formamidase